jgi:hypothetical protein
MADIALYHWAPNAIAGKPVLAFAEVDLTPECHDTVLPEFDRHEPECLPPNPPSTIRSQHRLIDDRTGSTTRN